jgi:hypothetical protein
LNALVHKKYAVTKPTTNAMTLAYSITTEYNPALSTICSKFLFITRPRRSRRTDPMVAQ